MKRSAKKQKRKSVWKGLCAGAALLIVLLTVTAIYVWRANYYARHFYKDTWINGIDCSFMTADQVKRKIQEKISEYELTFLTKEGETYQVTGPQFHLTYEDDNHVDELLSEQEPLQWIRRAFQG